MPRSSEASVASKPVQVVASETPGVAGRRWHLRSVLPGGVSKPIPKLTTRLNHLPLSPVWRILRNDNGVVADTELARALVLHVRGHWFDPSTVHHGDQPKRWSPSCFRSAQRLSGLPAG